MVAATLLTTRLTGEDYPYADIFSPQRFFPSASISAFWEGAGYAVRGIGRRLFVPAQTAAVDIARGHGGIVAWQGKKYGVYRHTDGTLFAVDIRCPHRGCELTWNDDEKSWDCPCHGSRFDYTGRRLSEPAKAALKPCKDFPQEIWKKRAVRLAFLPVFSYSAACQCLSVGRSPAMYARTCPAGHCSLAMCSAQKSMSLSMLV